jgi:hypothetical protein
MGHGYRPLIRPLPRPRGILAPSPWGFAMPRPLPPEFVPPPVGRCTRCRHEYHPAEGDGGVCGECTGAVHYENTGPLGNAAVLSCRRGRVAALGDLSTQRRRGVDRETFNALHEL